MASNSDDTGPGNDPPATETVTPLPSVPLDPSGAPTDLLNAIDRHPSALGRHLDHYLAAVAKELELNGVLTAAPQRSDPAHRLIGSIVLDCTALQLAAWIPEDQPVGAGSLGGAVVPDRPAPVVLTWDEDTGWCVGLHHDPTRSSRRYLRPNLLPAARTVADFVVGVALGQPLGATHPIASQAPDRPRLRLVDTTPAPP